MQKRDTRPEGLYLKFNDYGIGAGIDQNTPVIIERVNGDCSVSEFTIARDEAHKLPEQIKEFLASATPSGVPADDMTYIEKLARELALRVLGRSEIPISSYNSEQKAKEIVELLTYSAARKPSTPPWGEPAKALKPDEVWFKPTQSYISLAHSAFQHEKCASAPEIDRLRERLKALPKLAQMWDKKKGTITLVDSEAVDAIMREALAAAPPATCECGRAKRLVCEHCFGNGAADYTRHASAERLRKLEQALQQIANSNCSCASTYDKNWHGKHCLKAIALRALPPSTGEKAQ